MSEFDHLKKHPRYTEVTLLEKPVLFYEKWAGRTLYVQIHDLTPVGKLDARCPVEDIIGFSGCFVWKDDEITSVDGDSYTKVMEVYGYEEFELDEEYAEEYGCKKGLDILVKEW